MEKYKDKLYELVGTNTPVINRIPSRHTRKNPLLWFDEEKGHNRELRYATNQKSPFVDEQKGVATLGHIAFRNGKLHVEGKQQNLIKFLDIHPMNGRIFREHNKVEIAEDELDQPVTYVPNRNMMLLSIAASYAESRDCRHLYYGAQAQDEYGYWDCTEEFLEKINTMKV